MTAVQQPIRAAANAASHPACPDPTTRTSKSVIGRIVPICRWEFPIERGEFPVDAGDIPIERGEFPVDAGDIPIERGEFPVDAGDIPIERGEFPVDAGDIPIDARDAYGFSVAESFAACARIAARSASLRRRRLRTCCAKRGWLANSRSWRIRKSQYSVVNGQASSPTARSGL
jgi:hypothetical protein